MNTATNNNAAKINAAAAAAGYPLQVAEPQEITESVTAGIVDLIENSTVAKASALSKILAKRGTYWNGSSVSSDSIHADLTNSGQVAKLLNDGDYFSQGFDDLYGASAAFYIEAALPHIVSAAIEAAETIGDECIFYADGSSDDEEAAQEVSEAICEIVAAVATAYENDPDTMGKELFDIVDQFDTDGATNGGGSMYDAFRECEINEESVAAMLEVNIDSQLIRDDEEDTMDRAQRAAFLSAQKQATYDSDAWQTVVNLAKARAEELFAEVEAA